MRPGSFSFEDTWESSSAEETYTWGQRLGRLLRPGDLLCLYGGLGAGKTLLTQGIGNALHMAAAITSPTFTMIHQYTGQHTGAGHHPADTGSQDTCRPSVPFTLVHMDLYRLRSDAEAEIIGVWDAMQPDNAVIIEWPEIIARLLPEDRYDLHITGSGDDPRGMRLCFPGQAAEQWYEWQNIKAEDNA